MYVISTGMACSVGLRAGPTCAAIRAGITRFDELPYVNRRAEPIVGAAVPGLTPGLRRGDRLIQLLSLALGDCLRSAAPLRLDWRQIPLFVGLAEPERPGGGAAFAPGFIERVQQALGASFHPSRSHTITQGHTAGFQALQEARDALRDPAIPACLVCGVDSYLNARTLMWLEDAWRLKTSENSDGLIPGEAGTAVLVSRRPGTTGSAVRITGLGYGYEQAGILSDDPLLGLGLAAAFRGALGDAGVQMHEIGLRIADVSGESYGFREQTVALSRILRVRRDTMPIWHCADAIGDIGAASGPGAAVLAFHAFMREYAPGDRILCSTSAIPGQRAAIVLRISRPDEQGV